MAFRPHSHARRNGAAALIAGAILASFAAFAVWSQTPRDPLETLARAWPRSGREMQPRLSGGFPWAPLQRSIPDEREKMALLSAVSAVRDRAYRDASARHASAVAQMMAGDVPAALKILESHPADAAAVNDLAAAQFALATAHNSPEWFAKALVSVDAALRINPRQAEAHFNRALILERLGTRDLARMQWEEYLRLDPASDWAAEARAHVQALAPEESFADALRREYPRVTANAVAAHELARRHRQAARISGETEILGEWGRAMIAGDATGAAKHLHVARELAAELARNGGNRSFADMVAAIDRATVPELIVLAAGHVHLHEGRRDSNERRYDSAERRYRSAATELARGGSPAGALRAEMYAANMAYEQGHHGEARRAESRLLDVIPDAYPAYRAETLWMLGAIAGSEGRFGPCLDFFTRSLPLFERLGEDNYAAMVRGQMVFALDRLDDPRAWNYRILMLRELGRQITSQQTEALGSVTRAALMEQNWPMALSFLRLEIDIARKTRGAALIQSLLYRAETYGRMGKIDEAMRDLREARQLLADAQPGASRERLEAIADAVEGTLTPDSAAAIALLSRAVEFQATKGRRGELPAALRKRAAAYRAAGEGERAAADLERGIAEIERHRGFLPGGEGRWGAFHVADELFRDAIDLALTRGDVQRAFRYADRARARTLLETVGVSWDDVKIENLPRRTAIVDYAAAGDGLAIFLIDASGVRAFRRPVSRSALLAAAAKLRDDAGSGDEQGVRQSGRALARDLFDPIESELRSVTSLVIVAEPRLAQAPFAALSDAAGQYLAERFAISVAPSAAFYLHRRVSLSGTGDGGVLIVTADGAGEPLPGVAVELRALQRIYPGATRLHGDRATRDGFIDAARNARSIHFAGHSISDDGTYLLLEGGDGATSRLDQARIAELDLERTEVIVLAACGTASGESRATEGTISVARSFLAAGVPSVVATLWPIADRDSAQFFPAVHSHLVRGNTPAMAVQAAQIEWIQKRRPPAMWAAVQVIGR